MSRVARTLQKGFTFIEIMAVVLIMGLLLGVTVPVVLGKIEKSKVTSTETTLRSYQQAIDSYHEDVQPAAYPESLQDLIATEGPKGYAGPYVKAPKGIVDGWTNELHYERTPGAAHPYELYSTGGSEDNPEEKWLSAW